MAQKTDTALAVDELAAIRHPRGGAALRPSDRAPMDLDELLDEAIPLMAEDVREARARLGITSARAAKQAGLEAARYEALEKGGIRRSRHNASDLVSVARRLGLESVRASYVDEIGQYMRIDLAADGPLTVFIDALEADPAQLKDQGYFVNPYVFLAFFESIDSYSTFESRNRVDKQVVEMWIAAVFTLCLDPGRNYRLGLRVDGKPIGCSLERACM